MRTKHLKKTTLCLAGSTLLAATLASSASTVSLGTLTPFTGGDAGEGLDLSGNVVYALNLGGTAQTVQGVNFAQAVLGGPPAGVTPSVGTLEFNYSAANPGGANGTAYGATSNDGAMNTIVNSVWYNSNFTLDLAVTPGTQYQLQLILQEAFFPLQITAGRNFDISVDGGLAVDDLALGLETNGANEAGADQGLVYTYNFTATGSSFQVALDDNPLETGDGNAVLAGVVLTEQIPEPSTIVLFGLGFLGSILRRRR
jgi:hypothetical protein